MKIDVSGLYLSVATLQSDGSYFRTTFSPDDDLAGQPVEVQDAGAALWTTEALANWNPERVPDAGEQLASERATMVCSRFQARAALLAGGLLATADGAVAASGNALMQMAWADANEFRRDSPSIAAMAPVLGLSPAQIDDLFRTAMTIRA